MPPQRYLCVLNAPIVGKKKVEDWAIFHGIRKNSFDMIKRWYEVSCDYCGAAITHLPYRPDKEELDGLGCVFIGGKLFCCKDCAAEYSHDRDINRYGNLKQYGKR